MKEHMYSDIKECPDVADSITDAVSTSASIPTEVFIAASFQNAITSLTDLKNLAEAITTSNSQSPCQLLSCPRLDSIRKSVVEAIQVLENTKNSFKSKELADLRKKLEALADQIAV